MFCPKCGNEVQEGSAFCGKCGAPVGVAAAGTGTAGACGAPSPKKNGAKIGIIAAAAVVVLLVVIGFATNGFGLGGVQPKEAVDVSTASQEQQAAGAGEGAEGAGEDAANGDAEGQSPAASATVKSAVEAYTWDELSQISAEIAAAGDEVAGIEVAKKYNLCTPDGQLDGTQVKSVTLTDGTQTTVQIIGFNHDEKTSGGKAGITFIFGNAIAEMPMNPSDTNAGGWEASQPRAYLNSDGMALLPQELVSKISAVDKLTNNIGETENASSVSVTSDALWLPSATEVCGVVSWFGDGSGYDEVVNAEGSEYKLYRDESVDSEGPNEILVKTYNGEPCLWWERSPYPFLPDDFLYVDDAGNASFCNYTSYSYGVVPCFCI